MADLNDDSDVSAIMDSGDVPGRAPVDLGSALTELFIARACREGDVLVIADAREELFSPATAGSLRTYQLRDRTREPSEGESSSASEGPNSLPFDDGSFDRIIASGAAAHAIEAVELNRLLRADGVLFVTAGGEREVTTGVEEKLRARFDDVRRIPVPVLQATIPTGSAVTASTETGSPSASTDAPGASYWLVAATDGRTAVVPDRVAISADELHQLTRSLSITDASAPATTDRTGQLEAAIARTRSELRESRDAAIVAGLAQAQEAGSMLARLSVEQGRASKLEDKVAALTSDLAAARVSEERVLRSEREARAQLAALRSELMRLRADAAHSRAGIELKRVSQRFEAEIAQLRDQLDAIAALDGTSEISALRRLQTSVLSTLHRPEPIAPVTTEISAEERGQYVLLARSLLFDIDWYLARNPDVASGGHDPVLHYLRSGWREGRDPGPAFRGDDYLLANLDIAGANINPLVHYLQHGAIEERDVAPPRHLSSDWPRYSQTDDPDGSPEPRYWFFVGDTVDWIGSHRHLTGVGRVTAELLFAAVSDPGEPIGFCVRGPSPSGLIRFSSDTFIDDLAHMTGRSRSEAAALKKGLRRTGAPPRPGDHIFFTGVVWSQPYTLLFRLLSTAGIRFTVLVHDIIPALEPEIADPGTARSFSEWLATTLQTATMIAVSTDVVAQDIRRWSVSAGLPPHDDIRRIAFGVRALADASKTPVPIVSRITGERFVLSVGTIDARKNQAWLLPIWERLLEERGGKGVPPLVLAGRDDIGLTELPAGQRLIQQNKLMVLEGLSDHDVAALYRACAFTIFPSLSEGYGLPVAESIAYGKLCLVSDLPAVRAHAGEGAWYFAPGDIDGALALVRRAIDDPEAIAATLPPSPARSWGDAFLELRAAASEAGSARAGRRELVADRFTGTVTEAPLSVLRKASRWCTGEQCQVSIIVVNWNAAWLTLDCIRQIWAETEGIEYEIIIADNGSSEQDLALLRGLGKGIRLIEIGCNRFFGEANNIAVEEAAGEFVCLLNNDAFVQEGWIEALVNPIRENDFIAATGPMFLYPDGRVQEAGGTIDVNGYPIRLGRGDTTLSSEVLEPRIVDYVSAAALMMRRSFFEEIGGFDLGYEPVYYEDTDLCFKIRAYGKSVLYCPEARVIHIEGAAANGNAEAERHRQQLGDLNRAKFIARWGRYLKTRDQAALDEARKSLSIVAKVMPAAVGASKRAIVYTPYPLTPGGGERYLLSIAAALTRTHAVSLATLHRYSHMRLRALSSDLGLDLSAVTLLSDAETSFEDRPDIQVVMGNHIIPPVPACGRINLYHCQFPFPPLVAEQERADMLLEGYNQIVVNSRFTELHVQAALDGGQLPAIGTTVLPPPVPPFASGIKTGRRILTVGRFFLGGHSKRHDKLIEAFKRLADGVRSGVELHIAGSSTPDPTQMAYIADLVEAARGYPIHFHVNASAADMAELYASADIYWHGTGLGTDLVRNPWAAEHFGIAIVEAMSAGAIPFALKSGGAREIIQDGVDGFLYKSVNELVDRTAAILSMPADRRAVIGRNAEAKSRKFGPDAFTDHLDVLIHKIDANQLGEIIATGAH